MATPATAISTRYNTAITDCNTWNTDITNIINRYYSVKKTNYGPIRTRMAGVITRFNDGTNGYNVKISNINSAFTSIITILEGLVSTVVDPNYGMVAGLNCLLLGEDINLLANTACNKLFVTLSMLRLTLGLAAFGILFSMCCTTCSGVRAFKHSQRIGLIQPK